MRAYNRVNTQGFQYTIVEQHGGLTLIRHRASDKYIVVPHDAQKIERAWAEWRRGKTVQQAFPFLHQDEREFLISGLTNYEHWKITRNQMEHE